MTDIEIEPVFWNSNKQVEMCWIQVWGCILDETLKELGRRNFSETGKSMKGTMKGPNCPKISSPVLQILPFVL